MGARLKEFHFTSKIYTLFSIQMKCHKHCSWL